MKKFTDIQQRTLDIIKARGKGNPITGAELTYLVDIEDQPRAKGANMRSVIHALRVKGQPICANNLGYWWPASQEELSAYISEFQARVTKQQEAVDSLYKGMGVFVETKTVEGPLTITTSPSGEKVVCECSIYQQLGYCNHTDAYKNKTA